MLQFVLVAMVIGLSAHIGQAAPPKMGTSDDCPYAAGLCPADCDRKPDAHGGCRCLCGVPFFRWPQRNCPNSRRRCPQECGHILDEMGCRKCFCGTNPFFRFPWMPKPARKSTLSKHVQKPPQTLPPTTPKHEPEPEFLLDVRTFEGPKRVIANATDNRMPEDGHVF